jgi:hypothetical protein
MKNTVISLTLPFLLFVLVALTNMAYSQVTQVTLAAPGEVEGAIKLHMMPFYGYEGDWHVVVKEPTESGDTIVTRGEATFTIVRDSIRFKRDSAALTFKFKWKTKTDQRSVEMHTIEVRYSWDAGKHIVSVEHWPDPATVIVSPAWPIMDFSKRELYYEVYDHPSVLVKTHWKLFDDKIYVELKRRTSKWNTYRTQFLTFDRLSN